MATKKAEVIEIKPIEIAQYRIRIMGDTPLIEHAWSEKAKREMLEAQQGKKKGKSKSPKNPVNDFVQSLYWLSEKPEMDCYTPEEEAEEMFVKAIENGAKFGFPITGFKQAAISAAYRMGWSKDKASLRGAFFLKPVDDDPNNTDMAVIQGDAPIMREDMVRIGMGTADIRYRGQFNNWYTDLILEYNVNGQFSLENIINMVNAGGYVCGVGEWRAEKDGQNGSFHVVAAE